VRICGTAGQQTKLKTSGKVDGQECSRSELSESIAAAKLIAAASITLIAKNISLSIVSAGARDYTARRLVFIYSRIISLGFLVSQEKAH